MNINLAVEEEILDVDAIMDYMELVFEEMDNGFNYQVEEIFALLSDIPEELADVGYGSRSVGIVSVLRTAVEKEFLSQDIAEDILAYLDEKKPVPDEIDEDTENLSRKEMRDYMEENMPVNEDILDDLMGEGYISGEQAEDLKEILIELQEQMLHH